MSLASRTTTLATRIAQEINTVRAEKADVEHSHAISDVSNLQATLDAKLLITTFNAYKLLPVVEYTGTAWPTRVSVTSLIPGYSGRVRYESSLWPDAPEPTDRLTNDIWERAL